MNFKGLTFFKTTFKNGVEFDSASGEGLLLMRVSLTGRADFSDARIQRLQFNGSMNVEGDAIFRRSKFDDLRFALVVFRKSVDLQGAQITSQFEIRRVSFEGDLHMEDAILPRPSKVLTEDPSENRHIFAIEDVTFDGGVFADRWQLLAPVAWWQPWKECPPLFRYVSPSDADETTDFETMAENAPTEIKELRLWREFKHAFQSAGNLDLENYAEYSVRILEERELSGSAKILSVASRLFWGYGVRPLRVALWLAVVILAFAALYWGQLSDYWADEENPIRQRKRIKNALMFSWKTAWELKYGFENSNGAVFRTLTIVESALGKILIGCFAYSLSHTSPLLNDLVKKLLP
jgi:hypothetical protein